MRFKTDSTSASSVKLLFILMNRSMWYVYILNCDQKTFYVGMTNNLESRLADHRNKGSFFTKKFSDIELVHSEQFNSKSEAAKREQQLKGWSRVKKIAMIHNSL